MTEKEKASDQIKFNSNTARLGLGGFVFGIFCLGICVGVIWSSSFASEGPTMVATTPVVFTPDSAASNKNMSMATGLVSEDVEGLFVLDHQNGELVGTVINPTTGAAQANYRTNVFSDLNVSKDSGAEFVMTTGRIKIRGQRGNQEPALCVIYVGDASTGKVAGYSMFYNRARANKGAGQVGKFKLVFAGQTRGNTVERD